jgi:hypothetical protein
MNLTACCPTCGMLPGSCRHTTEGQVLPVALDSIAWPRDPRCPAHIPNRPGPAAAIPSPATEAARGGAEISALYIELSKLSLRDALEALRHGYTGRGGKWVSDIEERRRFASGMIELALCELRKVQP